jgi:DNA-binding response OmpR family regulator
MNNIIQPESKILIIDDEPEICVLLKSFLSKKSSEVDYALTLKDGMDKVKTLNPTVIFLDNNLPDGTGLEYIEAIKSNNENVYLVMLSAMTHLKDKAISAGANIFLEKPISLRTIQNL